MQKIRIKTNRNSNQRLFENKTDEFKGKYKTHDKFRSYKEFDKYYFT